MSRAKTAFAGVASAAFFVLLAIAILPVLGPGSPSLTAPPWIGESLWVDRGLDLAVQSFILLAGVFVVVLLLREDPGDVSA